MALSQLRQMVIEGDRPAAAQPASGFTKLPDGSLIMRGQPKPTAQPPGMLSGLMGWAKSKLNPAPPVDQYWIPPAAAPAPVAAAPAVAGPGSPLPSYNDAAWNEIAAKAADQERVAKELGTVSSNIMNNERLIQGRWFDRAAPKRVD